MRKILIAVLLAGGLASPALADHKTTQNPNAQGPFANRGQCQSTLVQARNVARRAANTNLLKGLATGVCRLVSEVNLTETEFLNVGINAVRDSSKFVIDFD